MKVLFIRSNPVNPDSRVEKEANSLIRAGYDVTVLGWDRDADYDICESTLLLPDGTAKCYRVGIKASYGSGLRNLKNLARYQFEILRFLQKHKKEFDVIHACDFDTAFTALHFINRKQTKFVYDIFDYYADAMQIPSILKPLIVALDSHIIAKADATIICTEQRREQIGNTHPRLLEVIHNSPPTVEYENESILSSPVMKIAYFGILCPEGRLIRELMEIVAQNTQYELHIGGFGQLADEVNNYSQRYKNIIYYGRTPYQDVLRIESQCDILTAIYDPAVPNHYYAAPNKFYEALMLGKPVVMARNTGMSNVITENDVGELIEYGFEGLANGLTSLWNKQTEWVTMGKRMKQLYKESYSWNQMEARLVTLYNGVISCSERSTR